MEEKNDVDALFEVKNAFYIGNYQNCINSASKLRNLSNEVEFLRDIYVYRSYIALKKYKIVLDEIQKKSNKDFQILEAYSKYLLSQDSISFDETSLNLHDTSDLYKIIMAKYFIKNKDFEKAFEILIDSDNLECLSIISQIYIQIYRIDLARNILLKMQAIDEDSVLTQLSSAWVNLASSTEKGAQEALYIFQEYCDKYTPSIILLNGLASAHVILKNYEEAETYCREALEKDPNDSESLINLNVVLQILGKQMEADRLLNQVLDEFPQHPFAMDYRNKESEFDRLCQMYKEGVKILPPPKG